MVQILDRYFTTEFFKYFIGALILLTGVATIAKVMEYIGTIAEFKGDFSHVAWFLIYNIPNFVTIVIAPSLMFAVSFTVALFFKNNEMAVIMAAGRSFQRVLFPLVIFTLLLSGFMLWFNEMVTYPSNFKAYNELNIIRGKTTVYRTYDRSNFEVKAGNRFYHIGKFRPNSKEIIGLHILQLNDDGGIKRIIESDFAAIKPEKWKTRETYITEFDKEGQFIGHNFFKEKDLPLPEASKYFEQANKKFEETNIFDLMRYIKEKKARGEPYLEYEVEFYWHLSFPLITFFVVLIGGTIGSQLKKGAMATSVGLAILLTISYYLVMFFGKSLGNNGTLPPFVAGWLANIVFLIVSIYVLWRYHK